MGDVEERLGALHAIECLVSVPCINAVRVGGQVRKWAQDCVQAMAGESEPSIRRASVCAIACAVQDTDPDVRQWARDFLSRGSGESETAAPANPVYALVRLASSGSGEISEGR